MGNIFIPNADFFYSEDSTVSVSHTILIFLVHYLKQHMATCCKSCVTVLKLFPTADTHYLWTVGKPAGVSGWDDSGSITINSGNSGIVFLSTVICY